MLDEKLINLLFNSKVHYTTLKEFVDQLGRIVAIENYPKRIISLVPSLTELLFDLGLDDNIIGITQYCIEPKNKVSTITKVGGTKKLNIDLIKQLSPDLIVASKEENEKDQILQLELLFPIWVADIIDFNSSLSAIKSLSEITNKVKEGEKIVEYSLNVKSKVNVEFSNSKLLNKKVLYFIWRKPYMVVGRNTYINSILEILGFRNCALELNVSRGTFNRSLRYLTITEGELKKMTPDFVFLSTEPYPFQEKHFPEFLDLFPNSQIIKVRGDIFSWYGSRFYKSLNYFLDFKQRLIQKLNMNCN